MPVLGDKICTHLSFTADAGEEFLAIDETVRSCHGYGIYLQQEGVGRIIKSSGSLSDNVGYFSRMCVADSGQAVRRHAIPYGAEVR
jgi:hypothetical protein